MAIRAARTAAASQIRIARVRSSGADSVLDPHPATDPAAAIAATTAIRRASIGVTACGPV
jgi:hypothetical protein